MRGLNSLVLFKNQQDNDDERKHKPPPHTQTPNLASFTEPRSLNLLEVQGVVDIVSMTS